MPGEGDRSGFPGDREVVRQWLLWRLKNGASTRMIAREVGVSHGAVHKFKKGTPAPAQRAKTTWNLWRRWYVVDRAARSTDDEAQEIAAMVLHYAIVPAFKGDWPRGAREFADATERTCAELGRPVPGWVEILRESARTEEMRPPPDVRY